ESAAVEKKEPVVEDADPQPAGRIFVGAADVAGGEALGRAVVDESAAVVAVQTSSPGAGPDRAGSIAKDRVDKVQRQPVAFGQHLDHRIARAKQAAGDRANPDRPLAIDIEHTHQRRRGAGRYVSWRIDRLAVAVVDPDEPVRAPVPDRVLTILRENAVRAIGG